MDSKPVDKNLVTGPINHAPVAPWTGVKVFHRPGSPPGLPRRTLADDRSRRMFARMLAHWSADVLTARHTLAWPEPDPVADYRDRDWSRLYRGDLLDD